MTDEKTEVTAAETTAAAKKTVRKTATKAAAPEAAPSEPAVKVSDTDTVTVRNGYDGILVWENPRTKETFIWEENGSEQDITVGELRLMKQTGKAFFENNWILIDDAYVLEYLGVQQYYTNILADTSFGSVVGRKPSEIKSAVAKLTPGQKNTLISKVGKMVSSGEMDSLKTIAAFEESLGVQFIDR